MDNQPHIGSMLRKYLDKHLSVRKEVAQKIGVPSTAIYSYEKRSSTQASNLWRLSHALQYNFFMDLANALPAAYARNEFFPSAQDALIAQQAEEIRKLQWENQLMKELLAK
ncbi:helix-turn-helix domain-containing protein [Flavobacterium sp. 3HN19-14]|uniref:helix-turn-helix domain-containing protein n=1 Tax=Flavobacterium sp. 3HN19-14 TaxID=3448133 RepID=UPI003EDECA98